MLQPGQALANRYLIVRLLGQGGMGAVYLAHDLNLGRKVVAIKENLDLSQAAQDQFRAEAVILARLSHPGLPQVTDHFLLPSGAQYLVMQYVEGEDLDQLLARRGPLPEPEVLAWMAQVADALYYMHSWVDPATGQVTPVVHRDIKPANIKLTPAGQIMLVDFGIAKYQQPGGTKTGARAASPGFSPLEQYSGGTDVRSDVYSFGATLYCLLTGQVPPEAPDLASSRKVLAPPRSVAPTISPNTEAVILRAMRPSMFDRHQSIAGLVAELFPGVWRVCGRCAALNRAGGRFCLMCGSELVAAQPGGQAGQAPPTGPARRAAIPGALVLAALVVLGIGGLAAAGMATGVLGRQGATTAVANQSARVTATATVTRTSAPGPGVTARLTATTALDAAAMTASVQPPATATLPPTATPTATPIPPATHTLIPTQVPTLTPAPSATPAPPVKPACRTPVRGEFAGLWEANWQALGCPLTGGASVSPACEQAFQGGHLFWRSDTTQVYIVYDRRKEDGADLMAGNWFIGPREWGWDGSDPQGVGLQPPAGLYEPVGGLGWLWRQYLGGASGRLGWALAKEYCFERLAVAQNFENGIGYRSSDPKVYGLLNSKQFVAAR